jgi:hypothetical protein
MSNTYITAFEYRRASTGQETNTLIGNLLRLSGGVTAGGTSLSVTPNTTGNLNQYDPIWIFDGANSEMVTVTANTGSGANTIPVTALQFNHAAGTTICGDGTMGSLGETIFMASANLEEITQQALIQATYSETYTLRTMDANINSDLQLTIRTRQFPVTAISALSIETNVSDTITLDPTQAVINSQQKLMSVPVISQIGNGPSQLVLRPPINQTSPGFVNLTYIAGFPYASMPWQYKQAAVLLTSVLLSDRANATGAAEYQMGKVKRTVYLRGDLSGESSLYKRAVKLLEPVTRER